MSARSPSSTDSLVDPSTTSPGHNYGKRGIEPWDAAEYLTTKQDVIAYLDAALAENDPQLVTAALGDIARSKGMAKVAADSGLGRESLYKSMSESGNPEFATGYLVGPFEPERFDRRRNHHAASGSGTHRRNTG